MASESEGKRTMVNSEGRRRDGNPGERTNFKKKKKRNRNRKNKERDINRGGNKARYVVKKERKKEDEML